jgi:hypothetical protein
MWFSLSNVFPSERCSSYRGRVRQIRNGASGDTHTPGSPLSPATVANVLMLTCRHATAEILVRQLDLVQQNYALQLDLSEKRSRGDIRNRMKAISCL